MVAARGTQRTDVTYNGVQRPGYSRRADCRKDCPAVARDEALIGCIGKLVVATRGSAGPGEVEVSIRGGREALIAWSAEPLPKGTTVLVIESRGHRAVDVSPWTDPLEDFS
jgi:membrane protein implicated in regulation of membrane protease activity